MPLGSTERFYTKLSIYNTVVLADGRRTLPLVAVVFAVPDRFSNVLQQLGLIRCIRRTSAWQAVPIPPGGAAS